MTDAANNSISIRYVRSKKKLYLEGVGAKGLFGGIGLERIGGSAFFAPLDEVSPVRLTALRAALLNAERDNAAGYGVDSYVRLPRRVSLLLSSADISEFDAKHSPSHDNWIDIGIDGSLLVCSSVGLTGEDWTLELIESTVAPLLHRLKATFVDGGEYGGGPYGGNPWPWNIRFKPAMNRTTVGDVMKTAGALQNLLRAADKGGFDGSSAWDLVKAGHVTALYGQHESNWLEAKTFDWDISSNEGKIELAQDVARFANSDAPALMLVGLGTKRIGGVEAVCRGPGLTFSAREAQRHHQIVDQHVYPPVVGLQIQPVPDAHGGDLLAFYIPEQPAEMKPFLVHGAIAGGRFEGAFFSVVQRRGEQSIPVTAQSLHSQIVAGRAFIRFGSEVGFD